VLRPAHHDVNSQVATRAGVAGLRSAPPTSPLFRRLSRKAGSLTPQAMTTDDMRRILKQRMARIHLPEQLSPHSFRVGAITDLLSQGVPLEDVQNLAGHADPRSTRLYDRRQKKVMRSVVDRISV
jgi:site-specific recombinase XerD